MINRLFIVPLTALLLLIPLTRAEADTWTITLDEAARSEPATGRIVLYFVTPGMGRWESTQPVHGPFYSNPQPIFSVAVKDLVPGGSITIPGSTRGYPGILDDLDGPVRVQAVLDGSETERSFLVEAGNVHSRVLEVELEKDREDEISITLDQPVKGMQKREDTDHLKWVKFRSKCLSKFYGREVFHRAGVALPPGYGDDPERKWPTVYVVPGYGGRHGGARRYAGSFASDKQAAAMPRAVYIVLDPESPLGHHGFVDSPNHGPRGSALVEELIPYLEDRFHLAADCSGRIITGHSSGGWTSLWLQLNWPQVFGACFSSAPDPIDFRAFQRSNLYEDDNVYVDGEGNHPPSMRVRGKGGQDRVTMTVQQEGRMEWAIHPSGNSGEQWDAWEAMFSPPDEGTGYPQPMFDGWTGVIDKAVVKHWKQFDMSLMVRENWELYGPIVMNRVRLVCGTKDSFYLNRAVAKFKEEVDRLSKESDATNDNPCIPGLEVFPGKIPEIIPERAGYIELIEGADHGSVSFKVYARWQKEMREFFRQNGFKQE